MTANENQQLWSAHLIAKRKKYTIPFDFILMHSSSPQMGLAFLCKGEDDQFRLRGTVAIFTASMVIFIDIQYPMRKCDRLCLDYLLKN